MCRFNRLELLVCADAGKSISTGGFFSSQTMTGHSVAAAQLFQNSCSIAVPQFH